MNAEEDMEKRISELELQVEEMERTVSVLYAVAFGFLSYILWGNWVASLFIAVVVGYIHWRYISKKPFSTGTNSDESSG